MFEICECCVCVCVSACVCKIAQTNCFPAIPYNTMAAGLPAPVIEQVWRQVAGSHRGVSADSDSQTLDRILATTVTSTLHLSNYFHPVASELHTSENLSSPFNTRFHNLHVLRAIICGKKWPTKKITCACMYTGTMLHNRAEKSPSTLVNNLQQPIAQHDLSHGHTTVKMEMTLLSLAVRIWGLFSFLTAIISGSQKEQALHTHKAGKVK